MWVPQLGWVGPGGHWVGMDGMGVPGMGWGSLGVGQGWVSSSLAAAGRPSRVALGCGSQLTGAAQTGLPAAPQPVTDPGQAGVRAQGLLPRPPHPSHTPLFSSVPMHGLAHGAAALCFLRKKEKSSLCLLLSSFLNIYIRGACGEEKQLCNVLGAREHSKSMTARPFPALTIRQPSLPAAANPPKSSLRLSTPPGNRQRDAGLLQGARGAQPETGGPWLWLSVSH